MPSHQNAPKSDRRRNTEWDPAADLVRKKKIDVKFNWSNFRCGR